MCLQILCEGRLPTFVQGRERAVRRSVIGPEKRHHFRRWQRVVHRIQLTLQAQRR